MFFSGPGFRAEGGNSNVNTNRNSNSSGNSSRNGHLPWYKFA